MAETHPVDRLIDQALAGLQGRALYDAIEACGLALTDARGQIHDTRAWAIFDVLQMLTIANRPLSTDERSILEGLRTRENTV